MEALMKVLAFVGYSGSGKTTLLEKLIARLSADGVDLAVIKHTV
jgi:molybdopterin-guanine dinucleotide biosynthesis protein B